MSVANENCQEAVFGLIRSEFWLCKCKHWHFPCQPCRQRVTERKNRPIRCAIASSVAQRIMWVGNRPVWSCMFAMAQWQISESKVGRSLLVPMLAQHMQALASSLPGLSTKGHRRESLPFTMHICFQCSTVHYAGGRQQHGFCPELLRSMFQTRTDWMFWKHQLSK